MLRVMTYNILFGGVDDDSTSRIPHILDVIRSERPDFLAVQEANEFELRDSYRLLTFERATGMRSYISLSPAGNHLALFARPGFQPVSIRRNVLYPTSPVLAIRFHMPAGNELTVCAAHFDPYGPGRRVVEAGRCLYPPPAIVMGDFNTLCPRDPGADETYRSLPRHIQPRYGLGRADGRPLEVLEQAGHVDVFRRLHPLEAGHTYPTPSSSHKGAPRRLDYIMATKGLAGRATRCDVIRNGSSDQGSDHYPLVAEFDVEL